MESFRRVAIVNRGEAAMRLVHAARDAGAGLTTIALHTQAERHAMFVREADEAVCFEHLGVPITGPPYLDLGVLEAALTAARAEAVWVGWGFVAERPEFADLCDRMGLTFIGPSGDVMRRLGDKIGAKKLAEAADVPVAPWSGGPVETVEQALASATSIGYPLMVKAAAGGGGRGIRRVDDESQLADAVERARSEAASSFGDATVFLERVVTEARHVEVQIIADDHGTVWAAGVRDCSLQRRNQKVIEESHSTALSAAQEGLLRDAAIRLARESDYRNAGTVEFLYRASKDGPEEDLFAFLEVNTRLQVEHPVTEVTTGLDLVGLQLHVAMGGRLEGECPDARGHAFEARLNAEDPAVGFAPAPGRIESMVLPTGPGVRVDTGVAAGDVIASEYDSMIAKIIAWGPTREAARIRLRRALEETSVLVAEGTTNKSFLLDLVDRPEVVAGTVDTNWLDRLTASDGHRSDRNAEVALMVAAIDVHEAESALDRARFLSSAARGRPEADPDVGHEVELRWRGGEYRVHVATGDLAGWYRLTLDGASVDVVLEHMDAVHARLSIGDRHHRVVSQTFRNEHLVEVDGVSHRFSRDDGGLLRAPSVALVVAIDVEPGVAVVAGQRVAVLEAMKMETAVTAPSDGVVEEVFVTPNTQVDAGGPLLRIGTSGTDGEAETGADRLRFADTNGNGRGETSARLDVLRAMLLGFDLVDDVDASVVAEHRHDGSMDDPVVRRRELELLGVFADLCGLTRERRTTDRDHGLESRSPREHFNAYLRSFDPDGEGLPERFRERLHDALAHYGIDALDRSPELEAATYRIHRAAQRRREQLPVITALLERRLEHCGGPGEVDEVRDTLDRLIAASQARYPAIGNLARSVRHRCVDRPLVDAASHTVETDVRETLEALVTDPTDASVRDHLVASAMPLMRVVGELDALAGSTEVCTAIADVLTRRFYKIREIEPIVEPRSAWPVVTTRYHHRGRDVRVFGVAGRLADVHEMVEELASLVEPAGEPFVAVDLYLRIDPETTVHDVAAVIDLTLGSVRLPGTVQRVAVVAAVSGESDSHDVHTLTWTRHDEDLVEDVVYRGLHPMIARRLNLWRLENFEVTRLPSAEDTHVFDCVATDQPSDERLIAVAEVRDITPLRDADGTLVALPELERVLASCLDGIRQAQAADPTRQRLEWNRVMLFVWPPVEISLDEVNAVAKRLVPMTTGLGIEQVMVQGRIVDPDSGETDDVVVRLTFQPGSGLSFSITEPPTAPMQPLDDYAQKVLQCRRRGAVYPYDLVPLLTDRGTGEGPGSFVELDLVDDALVPVDRAPGLNTAGVIVGEVSTPTPTHPDGMRRIAVFGDPTKSMGSIAEAECRRLLAAIDLAEREQLPIEWFALSAGARIAMDSGSENLDWVAAVLRRIVEFTQAPSGVNRAIHVVVAGVNVGAQPYWNAESTMLMHTRGILVMTPDSTMVLTGKQAIDFSGGVSADDNIGIGGHERIMGPNGQAQYWAHDVARAIDVLFSHYEHSYVTPGEPGPRRAATSDPIDRDVRDQPHRTDDGGFTTVGEIFDAATNPDRKKPFDIRSVMHAVIDHDHRPLERWADMAEAHGAVVYDAHLGGYPSTVIGIESRPLQRSGTIPADGPPSWSAGTLFPLSSKKVARAVNAASANRPVVVLANLSGFDGSPESLRRLQLEYGAEIGRAIVNFDGPIVLCVISRYHGGAFVVFSGRLNDRMQVLAVEGAHASVIGGAPAAAVVFSREVNARTQADERVQRLERAIATASVHDRARLRAELASVRSGVRNEMLGVVASEFDSVHSVERAKAVGSVHEIVRAERLRPELIAAIERGLVGTRGALG